MKIIRVGIVISAVALLAFSGCEKGQMTGQEGAAEDALKSAEGAAEVTGLESVSAATIVVGDKNWTVEVAQTEQERISGLSGRQSLASNTGMWFIFPGNSEDDFWMQGMQFDLDIVFIGEDMKVLNVAKGDKNNPTDRIAPAGPYLYVLEVAAGAADGVQAGDVVEYRIGPR